MVTAAPQYFSEVPQKMHNFLLNVPIIIVMFHLINDFTNLASQWLFLCATCLDSEPLHFASKSVEFLHASLYHWSLMNELTLDLSHYIWKSLVGDTSCCNFFPHC